MHMNKKKAKYHSIYIDLKVLFSEKKFSLVKNSKIKFLTHFRHKATITTALLLCESFFQ